MIPEIHHLRSVLKIECEKRKTYKRHHRRKDVYELFLGTWPENNVICDFLAQNVVSQFEEFQVTMIGTNALQDTLVSIPQVSERGIIDYLWPHFHGIFLVPSSKCLQSNVCAGALAGIGKKVFFQACVVEDAPPSPRSLVNALSDFVNGFILGMPQAAADEAIPWFSMDIVTCKRSFPPSARP